MSNERQIGLAVLQYELARKFLPAASTSPSADPSASDGSLRSRNWLVSILPFTEESALSDRITPAAAMSAPSNSAVRSANVAILRCPSDSFGSEHFMGTRGARTASFGDHWARGNYAANASLGFASLFWDPPLVGATPQGWNDRYLRGVMGHNMTIRCSQVTDGLSSTVMFAEVRAGVAAMDPRGVWALPGCGSSSLWAHGGIVYGLQGDAIGPNCMLPNSDDIMNCADVESVHGGKDSLRLKGMSCFDHDSKQATARSMHRGGVVACMGDGSVHWIDDSIESTPSTPAALSVWDKLMLSMDGQGGGVPH